MKLLISIFIIIGFLEADNFYSKIMPISLKIKQKMIKGISWRYECPVALKDLRYIQVKYWNFEGKSKTGELIVHRDIAKNLIQVFKELYKIKYPIRKMRLVSDYNGSDWKSIEADNTSAFNCRSITGNKNKWSNHAYGKAIDINPLENPYISRNGIISHEKSKKYRVRVHYNMKDPIDKALIVKDDEIVKIFKKYGWKWGGDWKSIKDYQHFEYIEKK